MKKIIKYSLIFIVIFLIVKLFAFVFINEYKTEYLVTAVNNKYFVTESFKRYNKDNIYSFTVKYNNMIYSFSYNKNLNKKKRIITDIKYYKSNKLKCIFPIYSSNDYSDLYCILGKKQVSYSYLKQINNIEIDSIVNKLKKSGYNSYNWNNSKVTTSNGFIYAYKENIPKDYVYTVWFYKGIYIVSRNGVVKKKLLDNDKYENNLSILSNKYYITFDTNLDSSVEYNTIILYNLKNNRKYRIKLDDVLSLNTYINGLYNYKIYITDNDAGKQYLLDPNKRSIEEIGDREIGFKSLKNGTLNTIRSNKNNYFVYTIKNTKINKLYGNVTIWKNKSDYYFMNKSGEFYQIINKNYNNPVLLFKDLNIKEIIIKDDNISYISSNTIYSYTNQYGLKPIIVDKELKYNYKNIYDFMKK